MSAPVTSAPDLAELRKRATRPGSEVDEFGCDEILPLLDRIASLESERDILGSCVASARGQAAGWERLAGIANDQRDELAAALRKLWTLVEGERLGTDVHDACSDARAALAKIGGGT